MFVNKVLLEHSCAHSLQLSVAAFPLSMAELSSRPLGEKFAIPYSQDKSYCKFLGLPAECSVHTSASTCMLMFTLFSFHRHRVWLALHCLPFCFYHLTPCLGDDPALMHKDVLHSFFFFKFIYYYYYFWLHWFFIAARGLSLVAASGGYSLLRCAGFFIAVASLVVEHGL